MYQNGGYARTMPHRRTNNNKAAHEKHFRFGISSFPANKRRFLLFLQVILYTRTTENPLPLPNTDTTIGVYTITFTSIHTCQNMWCAEINPAPSDICRRDKFPPVSRSPPMPTDNRINFRYRINLFLFRFRKSIPECLHIPVLFRNINTVIPRIFYSFPPFR